MAEGERGRPTKLTPLIKKIVLMALEGGATRKTAAEMAKVSPRTFQLWLRLGLSPDADPEYREFRTDVLRAEAEAVLSCVDLIRKAGKKDWRAAAWWLERHCPEYAKTKTFEPTEEEVFEEEEEFKEWARHPIQAEPLAPPPTASADSPDPVRVPVPATPAVPATPINTITEPCASACETPAPCAAKPTPVANSSTANRGNPRPAAIPANTGRPSDHSAKPKRPSPASAPVNSPSKPKPKRGSGPIETGSHRPSRSQRRPLCRA
ncbi:hypothetical protein [Fimbriiglobus ruber]|uniref:Uncharacterized protein n=1 Tax=Fimbriiglobus ruber TaxID=1908690 RepID=A0A225DH59_9BACT|nr:hypothetical protein [Fimbriiglobus ruber]OWK36539.1 hypothetical protein FRUB_09102 [Fimbriiglobus ruber]